VVADLAAAKKLVRAEKGQFSVGGMETKLQAVEAALSAGIATFIASGRKAGQIARIAAGRDAGTAFAAKKLLA
jgi:glutamate 5-kinase